MHRWDQHSEFCSESKIELALWNILIVHKKVYYIFIARFSYILRYRIRCLSLTSLSLCYLVAIPIFSYLGRSSNALNCKHILVVVLSPSTLSGQYKNWLCKNAPEERERQKKSVEIRRAFAYSFIRSRFFSLVYSIIIYDLYLFFCVFVYVCSSEFWNARHTISL